MPTYDYICKECRLEFELFQGINDAAVTTCPECKGSVRRIISGGAGIIFKGSGFYVTDNKASATDSNSKSSEKTENSTTEAPKTEKNSEKKKETAKSETSV
ncbi:MAG: hypothetical protein H8D23_36425 [Candidatus Brocadiales bacterium]|nr:hypothetical protein [Candidatus Brocadiales bacterium]MBL7005943.1 hypothetical protein [Spirochaetia bacterium]